MNDTRATLLMFAAITGGVLLVALPCLAVGRRLFGRRRKAAPPLFAVDPATGRIVRPSPHAAGTLDDSFTKLVDDAGLPVSPLQIVLLATVCAAITGGAALLWLDNVASGLIAALTVFTLIVPLLKIQRARRIVHLREALPPVLDLIARACRSGESLDQAIALVGAQAAAPWGAQFQICDRQMQAGLSVASAFTTLWRRTHVPEIRDLQLVATVHRQTGGNLAAMLEKLADNARDRLDFQRQFRSATAGPRFGSLVMTLVFVGVVGLLFLYDNEYSTRYFERPEGWSITAFGCGLLGVGLLWINRILRVDY